MSKKKRHDPPYWVTGPYRGQTKQGAPLPFVQLYADLLQAAAFCALSPSTKACYIAMCCEAKGQPCFIFPRTTADRYGINPRTLLRAVKELTAAGFIVCQTTGRITRTPNEYAFTYEWKLRDIDGTAGKS